MTWWELCGLIVALVGAGFAAGCGFTMLLVKNTEAAPPAPADLSAEREVELLPEWREQEYRSAITQLTIDVEVERRERGRWEQMALAADAAAAEERARVNGLRRFLRAHGFMGREVQRWLTASRKQR